MVGIGVWIQSASPRSSIIGLNRRKFIDADPSVYNSSPREMKKKGWKGARRRWRWRTIKFIMFAYFMQRKAKVYVKLTVRYTGSLRNTSGGRTKSLGIGSLKGNLLKPVLSQCCRNTRRFLFSLSPVQKKKRERETRVEPFNVVLSYALQK